MVPVLILGLVVIGVAAFIVLRGRVGPDDGMTSFQRQIDALSPEARRPVVDQVQRAAQEEADQRSPHDDAQPGEPGDDDPGEQDN